jgi:DNA-binding NarL/FixJ family response regulator
MKQLSNKKRPQAKPGQSQSSVSLPGGAVRVLLAESHALLRAGMRSLLDRLPQVQVVGEADQCQKIARMIEARHPHVLLLSVGMVGTNGLDLITRIVAEYPAIKVVMVSTRSSDEFVNYALRAGVCGFLLKDATPGELGRALVAVRGGKMYLSPAISKSAIRMHLRRPGSPPNSPPVLTPRQRQILEMITDGKTTKEIAHALGLSAKTVETHRVQLMKRLNIYNIPGLVRYAIRTGLTTLEK